MAKEKVRLWDRLKYKYKLSVINETSYEEVFNFRLSQLHVLTALSVLAVILVVLTILLIAFTGLREFIPGYPDGNMRQMIAQNALRVDSLENELLKRDRFFKSIRLVLNGEIPLPSNVRGRIRRATGTIPSDFRSANRKMNSGLLSKSVNALIYRWE